MPSTGKEETHHCIRLRNWLGLSQAGRSETDVVAKET